MTVRLVFELIAPIPAGHHVTVHKLETHEERIFGRSGWESSPMAIVCDDDARILYTGKFVGDEQLSYDRLELPAGGLYRLSSEPPVRGRVTACRVRTDHGDGIRMETVLDVELDRDDYR